VVVGSEALAGVHAGAPVEVHVEAAFAAQAGAAVEAQIEAPVGAQAEARCLGLGCDSTVVLAGLFVLAVAPSAVKAGELAHLVPSYWSFRQVWVLSVLPYLLWPSERCYTFNHRGVYPMSAYIFEDCNGGGKVEFCGQRSCSLSSRGNTPDRSG